MISERTTLQAQVHARLHRIPSHCVFTKKTLHLLGKADGPFWDVCGVVEDVRHNLITCVLYATEMKIIRDAVRSSGGASVILEDYFFPRAGLGHFALCLERLRRIHICLFYLGSGFRVLMFLFVFSRAADIWGLLFFSTSI